MRPSLRHACALVGTALLTTLAACGGGGGSAGTPVAPTPAPPPPPPLAGSLDATTSYLRSNTPAPTDVGRMLQGLGITGRFYDARATVDLDGDGVPELFVATGNGTPTALAATVYKRQADGSYADMTASFIQGPVPRFVHPRKAISADFNADGRADVYVLDHGFDQPPFPGALNGLLLSDAATGRLAVKAVQNDIVGFHHCGAAGDVDGNGTSDIFVCSQSFEPGNTQDRSSYILLNDGQGNMTLSRTGLPASLRFANPVTAELVDIDRDGRLDLFLGYTVPNMALGRPDVLSTIFWGSAAGFTDQNSTRLPMDAEFNTAYDFKAEDIDGDGRRDLLVLAVRGNLTGYYVHVFRQTAARTFVDESLARIVRNRATWEGSAANAGWFPWLHMTDLNGDGRLDIATGESSAFIPARGIRWIDDGRGVFGRAP